MPPEREPAVLDRDQLRSVTLEDEELMREILGTLIDDTARQIGALSRAIDDGNPGETARLAHYSKGACANVGASGAAALLLAIERSAACGDLTGCREPLSRLSEELERLRSEAGRI